MSICIKIFLALSLGFITSCSNNNEDEFVPETENKAESQPVKVNVEVDSPVKPINPIVPAAPIVTPPPPPPPPIPVPIDIGEHRRGNDDHDHDCPDQDSDGVCDPRDKCPGYDDRDDLDEDGSPDACDCEDDNADVGIGDFCSDTTTCAVSVCDPQGSGECIVTDAPFGTECGDVQEGDCDADNTCDGQGNCIDRIQPDGSACGNTAFAICDLADTCVNGECIDNRALEGTVCRATAGVCDVEEVCDGTFITCPDDAFVDEGTACRAAASECDAAEACTGASATCPLDSFAPNGVICGDQPVGLCDRENHCQDGVCLDLLYDETYLCRRPVDQECDVPEFCTGADVDCPVDIIVDPGTDCGGPGSDEEFCSDEPTCTPAGRCVGIPAPDGPTVNACNANNGEPRCDGFINCEDGSGVCVPTDGTAIECTEQIIVDPNQPPGLVNLALGEPTLFGWSVALYGEWAAVGNGSCSDRTVAAVGCEGLLYIYKLNSVTGEWEEHQTLSSEDTFIGEGAGTGYSVDMYGDLLIFGQKPVLSGGFAGQGGFTIARLVNDTWTTEFSLANDDGSFDFGHSVSIYTDGGSKQYAVSGSPLADRVIIYIYNYNGTGTWDQVTNTAGNDGVLLGDDVRVRGDIVVASAPGRGTVGDIYGGVKVWHRTGSGPFTVSYDVDGVAVNEGLGDFRGNNSLGLDADTGRFFVADRGNQVKVFQDNLTSATLLQTIANGSSGDSSHPGNTIALNGNTLLLGDPTFGGAFEGQVSIYTTLDDITWTFQEFITPSVAETTQYYGWSVSAEGGRLIVGGPSMDTAFSPAGNSRVYFYGLIP